MLGRQRKSVTVYEYDDGLLVRSVTTHDAEWAGEDLGYAKAHRRNEVGKCPGCGLPLAETTNPDNEGSYEAPPPTRCHACTPLDHPQRGHDCDDTEHQSGDRDRLASWRRWHGRRAIGRLLWRVPLAVRLLG
jgi:hypothetical protein